MLGYEKTEKLENPKKVVYSRLALPAITSYDLPAHFSARSEHKLREQMLNELAKTDFLVFTAFSRQEKERVNIQALIWCLEHVDTLTEITRKLATRETLASLYTALALVPHLFEGRRRGAIGTVENRELPVYRRTKMPYSIISEFEDGTGAIDNNVLFDRAVSLYSPDLEHVRTLIGEERVKRLMSRYPEYGTGEVVRADQRKVSWPRGDVWPTASQYDRVNYRVTMTYLRS